MNLITLSSIILVVCGLVLSIYGKSVATSLSSIQNNADISSFPDDENDRSKNFRTRRHFITDENEGLDILEEKNALNEIIESKIVETLPCPK
jgi:hypothetical protein